MGDVFQQLNWLLGNGQRNAVNRLMQRRRQRLNREPLEGGHQCCRKAVQPIAQLRDVFVLHLVQLVPHLRGSEVPVVQKRDEVRDRTLKVNVVFPQRVVGVDHQRLRALSGVHH